MGALRPPARVTNKRAAKSIPGAYTVDYTAGAWTDYGTYTATCTLTDTVAYKWADGTTTPKTLFFVITHPVDTTRFQVVDFVETVPTNGTNKATVVDTGISPQDNIKADFSVAYTRFLAQNAYLLAVNPGADDRQYLLLAYGNNGSKMKWAADSMTSSFKLLSDSVISTGVRYDVSSRFAGTNLVYAVGGVTNRQTITAWKQKASGTHTLKMFALRADGYSPSFVKFYGGSIMTNALAYTEALAREYVPAYDTQTKTFGLWEKVEGVFVKSASDVPFRGPFQPLVSLTFSPSATKAEDGVPVQFPNIAWVTNVYGEVVNYRATNYTLSYSRGGEPTDDLTSAGEITVTATRPDGGESVSAVYTITAPVTRTITVGAMAENGKLPLTFGTGSDMLLFAAKGTSDGEGTLTSWTSFENLGVIPAATTSYDYALPSDWGSTVTHLRFFFAPPDKMMTAQLAYVTADQSPGTEYLDTGVRASLRTTTEVDFKSTSDQTHVKNERVVASIGGTSTCSYQMYVDGIRRCAISLRDAYTQSSEGWVTFGPGPIEERNPGTWRLSPPNARYTWVSGSGMTNVESGVTTYGLSMPDHGSVGILYGYASYPGAVGEIRGARLWFDGAQVRNFVPAKGYKYANSTYTEVAGLFDTVEAKFYPSAGTADFTAGTAATLDAANLVHVYVAGQSVTVKAVAVPTADPASGSSLTYTGSEQKPTITPASAATGVTYAWGATGWTTVGTHVFTASLPPDDPTYVWSDGTTAAKVYTYTITKAVAPTITVTGYSGTYDGVAHNAITSVTGQQSGSTVEYSLNGSTGWTTTVPKVTNVSDSKKIYVRATNPNYETATGDAQATVLAKDIADGTITVVLGQTVYEYREGTPREPTVTVKDGGTKLAAGTSYTVSYTGSSSASTEANPATVTVTGTGNYTGTRTVNYDILPNRYTWVGPNDGGSWSNAANWQLEGYAAGKAYPGQYGAKKDANAIAVFNSGTYRIDIDLPNPPVKEGTMIKELNVDPAADLTFVAINYQSAGSLYPRGTNPAYNGKITLLTTDGAQGAPGLALSNDSYPYVNKELHVYGHTNGVPTTSYFVYGADNALMTFTDCRFGQATWTTTHKYVAFYNPDNTHAARLAITNTQWYTEFAAPNTLGTRAEVSIANSDVRMGMEANNFGGTFTIVDSLAAFNNVGPNASPAYYGDTVALTGLNVSGEDAKFVLSGNATLNGELHFDMPADGFANDIDDIVNLKTNKDNFAVMVTNLNVAFSGVAPVAIMKSLNLSSATLTVNASAVGSATGTYPLVRVGSGTLTAPTASDMTVSGVSSGFVGEVRKTADGKGLDLVITVPVDDVTWTWDDSKVNFWYTGESGTYPLVSGTYGGTPLVLGTDYTNVIVSASKTYTTNSVLPVGTYTNRVIGIGAYSGTKDVVIGFEVVQQKLYWTNASGSEAVGDWATGPWVKADGKNMGNDNARTNLPNDIVDVVFQPSPGTTASVKLGTEEAPSTSHRFAMASSRTAWLHDGYIVVPSGVNNGVWESDATMVFSNANLIAAGSKSRIALRQSNAKVVFAGTNSLPLNDSKQGVQPYFYGSQSGHQLCFENGATTIDAGINFYGGTSNTHAIRFDNVTVRMAKFDPVNAVYAASGIYTFSFKLGALNTPVGTGVEPMLKVPGTFTFERLNVTGATIDATAKTGSATYDIMTIPTTFDLYAPTNAAFSPAQLTANTTCAAGLVPQIVAVTNDTMQTIQLVIRRSITNATFTIDSPSTFVYNGNPHDRPEVVSATLDGVTLEEGKDFEVVGVATATDVGTYQIKLKGIGNYTDTTTASKSWTITGAVYTWKGGENGAWSVPGNWTPPAGMEDTYPDSKNKTAKFPEGTCTVNVDVSNDIAGFVLEDKKAVHVTLTGTGTITNNASASVGTTQSLRLSGPRLYVRPNWFRVDVNGVLYMDAIDKWPLDSVIGSGYLAMSDCHVVSTDWRECWTTGLRPLYATNCTVTVTNNFRNAQFFHFNLKDSVFGFRYRKYTNQPQGDVVLENSTLAVTNDVDAANDFMKFKNVTIADGTSRFTATGDFAPVTGGSWTFTLPATGYDAAPIQANNITIPSGHAITLDLTAVTAAGTYPLATATTALTIDPNLTTNLTLAADLHAKLVRMGEGEKTLAVEVWHVVSKPVPNTPLYYTGDEQTGVVERVGYTVANGTGTAPSTYSATATLSDGYRWAEDDSSGVLTLPWTILNAYKISFANGDSSLDVVIDKTWVKSAFPSVVEKQSPVQTELAKDNVNKLKGWEIYVLGFEASQYSTAAAVVQPVQGGAANTLHLKLGDWPATKPSDSGVVVKYQLMDSTTQGGNTPSGDPQDAPEFSNIDLSGWGDEKVHYYRIVPVFTNE